MYVILAMLVMLVGQLRRRRSDHDFAGESLASPLRSVRGALAQCLDTALSDGVQEDTLADSTVPMTDSHRPVDAAQAAARANDRVWGREFRTSGDVVVLLGVVCTALYIAIFVLIMQLD